MTNNIMAYGTFGKYVYLFSLLVMHWIGYNSIQILTPYSQN